MASGRAGPPRWGSMELASSVRRRLRHGLVDGGVGDERPGVAGPGRANRPAPSSSPEAGRGHVLELVGLVEDDHVVRRQDGAAGGQVVAYRWVLTTIMLGPPGPLPGRLGQAHVARRAAAGAGAFEGTDAEHRPGAGRGSKGRSARSPSRSSPPIRAGGGPPGRTARAWRRRRPRHRRGRRRLPREVELVAAPRHLEGPLAAQVVGGPSGGVGHRRAKWAATRGEEGLVLLVGELVLQGLGGRGHHAFRR